MTHPLLDVLLFAILNYLVGYLWTELENRGILPRPKAPPDRYHWKILLVRPDLPDLELFVPVIPPPRSYLVMPVAIAGEVSDPVFVARVVISVHDAIEPAPTYAAIVYARKKK